MVKLFAFFVLLSFPHFAQAEPQSRVISTSDHQNLAIIFQAAEKGKPTVVMLHGLAAVKEEWRPLCDELKKKGWGFVAYDARGHGASSLTQDAQGNPNGFMAFGKPGPGSPWEKMVSDVGEVIKQAKKISGPQSPIFLAGASLGANVALLYASQFPSVKGVVLLSAGLNYQEFKTEWAIQKISTIPILLVASSADRYAHDSAVILKSKSKTAIFWDDVKPGHGVQMFDPTLLTRLFQWLNDHA